MIGYKRSAGIDKGIAGGVRVGTRGGRARPPVPPPVLSLWQRCCRRVFAVATQLPVAEAFKNRLMHEQHAVAFVVFYLHFLMRTTIKPQLLRGKQKKHTLGILRQNNTYVMKKRYCIHDAFMPLEKGDTHILYTSSRGRKVSFKKHENGS